MICRWWRGGGREEFFLSCMWAGGGTIDVESEGFSVISGNIHRLMMRATGGSSLSFNVKPDWLMARGKIEIVSAGGRGGGGCDGEPTKK